MLKPNSAGMYENSATMLGIELINEEVSKYHECCQHITEKDLGKTRKFIKIPSEAGCCAEIFCWECFQNRILALRGEDHN